MRYVLVNPANIRMPAEAKHPIIEEFLCNYTHGRVWNIDYTAAENCITLGNYTEIDRGDAEFALNITDTGVYIVGCDYGATMRGYITFLEKLQYTEDGDYFYLETGCAYGKPCAKFRCAHLCVFPETHLDFFQKCVRACAVVKYSHIIVEFWGMLKFDCMKELAWSTAHSKETMKEIISEANALGLEVIPMFNHIGHASLSRGGNGQHVVLDQAPQYEYLYENYGWVWNFKKDCVRELHRKIREELIDICGKGSFFHLGCDEVHSYSNDENNARKMAEYINEIAAELRKKGRRAIMWHDMMLSKEFYQQGKYYGNASKSVSDILLDSIDKNILIADWQYHCHDELWKSSKKLKESGFEVICCAWDNKQNNREALDTVMDQNLYGVMHTTWYNLCKGVISLIYSGKIFYGADDIPEFESIHYFYAAEVIRKAMPSGGEYEKSGWTEKMTDMLQ